MPSSSDMVKANDDRLAFGSRMLKLKLKSFGGKPRRAPQRGTCVIVIIAVVPYGESTFKRNRPSFAVLMVCVCVGGGGEEGDPTSNEMTV